MLNILELKKADGDANKSTTEASVAGIVGTKSQSNTSLPAASSSNLKNNETTIINSTVTRLPSNDSPVPLLSMNNNSSSQIPFSVSNSSKPFQNQNITTNDYANVTKGLVDQHPAAAGNVSATTVTHNETSSSAAVNPNPKSDSKVVATSETGKKNHQEKPMKRSSSSSHKSKKRLYKESKASTRTLGKRKLRGGILRRSIYILYSFNNY